MPPVQQFAESHRMHSALPSPVSVATADSRYDILIQAGLLQSPDAWAGLPRRQTPRPISRRRPVGDVNRNTQEADTPRTRSSSPPPSE